MMRLQWEVSQASERSDETLHQIHDDIISITSSSGLHLISYLQLAAADTNDCPFHLTGNLDSIPAGRSSSGSKLIRKWSQPSACLPASPPVHHQRLSSTRYLHSSSDFIFIKKIIIISKTHLIKCWRTQLDNETFQPITLRPRKMICRSPDSIS